MIPSYFKGVKMFCITLYFLHPSSHQRYLVPDQGRPIFDIYTASLFLTLCVESHCFCLACKSVASGCTNTHMHMHSGQVCMCRVCVIELGVWCSAPKTLSHSAKVLGQIFS